MSKGHGTTVTIRVPLTLRRRGGRKRIVTPDGAPILPPRPQAVTPLLKAVARAHRWKHLLETGRYSSVTELAAAERINQSYVCRMLRLTLLAPEIVEAILDRQEDHARAISALFRPFPALWEQQRDRLARQLPALPRRKLHPR